MRGLCRQALDNALRTAVLAYAARAGVPIRPLLEAIDSQGTTKDRLKIAIRVLPGAGSPHVVELARQECDHYLGNWNGGAHGNSTADPVTEDEIAAARRACERLVGRR
ncbi:hypothetical protein N8J89_30685 [Crossiella sp. CA-258035]|uniref:hypothetical protein n=1 Tax=Crossiella sp. CA-258035 TaxID=2981138 RepID=UPI0024BC2DAE|nr:hypothetical protein [Crossiella sp. CA-258035]WHT17467.1 hypothetical protein N8J89_30685 [Crossiella sp. CA-258035]